MTLDREFLVGKKVTVLGLGIEGVDLVRYLASQGATVTVSDSKSPEALSSRINELENLPVSFSLGENRVEDVAAADILFVSQGVPLTLPSVEAAREQGVEISSMTKLFLKLCPGPVIGITGSSGKTTTTALVAAMFEMAERKHVVGGNIGTGLLGLLDCITPETTAILELSHSQLETADKGPHIACVLNVTPNHLDRYSWDEYMNLKLRILLDQSRDDIAVLNLDDEVACSFATEALGSVVWFSAAGVPNGERSAFVRNDVVEWRQGTVDTTIVALDEIPLRGAHNVYNVLAAVAVAGAAGLPSEAIAKAIREFKPVEHRLEFVAKVGDASFYNDTIATTPERTLAALSSFEERIVLLVGGREKHLPLEDFAEQTVARCSAIVCFGESAALFEEALASAAGEAKSDVPIERAETLADAVETANELAKPGDVVLLSPACASYDAYDNFEQRGEDFRRLVQELVEAEGS
ncbi:MAG: UDP-N-acetylmuramoyl-L-alanine--D-glutamate ligase [Chloroflexi bacterium]|nr:UDP-N-acetylmuramoyl-L-alanine--D-glutamate ligase [Chloroflexota bacterium]